MLIIAHLTKDDIGRKVIYGRAELPKQEGTLSSWNETYIFVKFGEHANACDPGDVTFAFDHCTVDSIGIKISGPDAQMIIEPFNKYLQSFAHTDGNCPVCKSKLGGAIGTFTWGDINGEGFCNKCDWPCRAIHRPTFDDGKELFEQALSSVLPYHPDHVKAVVVDKIIEDSWMSLVEAIKIPQDCSQYNDMQIAFYGGATTVLSTMLKLGRTDDESDVEVLEAMWNECLAFRDAVSRKD